jgi:YVTN family beta-propeller protein
MRAFGNEIIRYSLGCDLVSAVLAVSMMAGVPASGMGQNLGGDSMVPDGAKLPKNTVVAVVTVGAAPFGLAVTPKSDAVYVANTLSNTVSVISTATNTVTATIPVGNVPQYVAITPDGTTAFVSNNEDSTVSVISTATNTVVATFPVGTAETLEDLAVSPDGTQLYTCNFSSGYPPNAVPGFVSIIDTTTFAILNVIQAPYPSAPTLVQFTVDGKSAYVVNYKSVFQIDTASQTIVQPDIGSQVIEYNFLGLAITPNAGTIYVPNYRRWVYAFNATDGSLIKTIVVQKQRRLGWRFEELVVTPNGRFVYMVVNEESGPILTVIATAHNWVTGSIPIGGGSGTAAACLAVAPNGKRLYVSSDAGTVTVIDINP